MHALEQPRRMMMTEREKMLKGMIYNSRDPELIDLYWRARALLHEFAMNAASRDRMQYLQELVPNLGEGVWVEPPFFCEYGAHISIGRGTYINNNVFFQDCATITIGEYGLIGPGVQFCTAKHPVDSDQRIQSEADTGHTYYVTSASPIMVGNRVWIGAHVTILGGVTIGDDCVIGAGSVVTRDIPAGCVAQGVPCRVVKSIKDRDSV